MGQVEVGGRLYVGQQVLALETRDAVVHIAQLPLDHPQTLVNELRGADSDLVLIEDPMLIINLDQAIQDILRLLDRSVGDAQVDHRTLVVNKGGVQF